MGDVSPAAARSPFHGAHSNGSEHRKSTAATTAANVPRLAGLLGSALRSRITSQIAPATSARSTMTNATTYREAMSHLWWTVVRVSRQSMFSSSRGLVAEHQVERLKACRQLGDDKAAGNSLSNMVGDRLGYVPGLRTVGRQGECLPREASTSDGPRVHILQTLDKVVVALFAYGPVSVRRANPAKQALLMCGVGRDRDADLLSDPLRSAGPSTHDDGSAPLLKNGGPRHGAIVVDEVWIQLEEMPVSTDLGKVGPEGIPGAIQPPDGVQLRSQSVCDVLDGGLIRGGYTKAVVVGIALA